MARAFARRAQLLPMQAPEDRATLAKGSAFDSLFPLA
jgi:hypothetical protein